MTKALYEPDWNTIPDMLRLKVTLWRYMLLSQLTTGKTRRRYKEKRTDLSGQIQKIDDFYFKNTKQRMPFDWFFLKKRIARIIKPPMDGINLNKREQEVIVSLTTYSKRMNTVWIVLKAMLSQTHKPDKILLYLAEEEFSEHALPSWTKAYRKAGVEFVFCRDLKPHKKYYYAMKEHPEAIVITVDDDLIYDCDLIETLMKCYRQFPHAISSMRAHEITFDAEGHILPYLQWEHTCSKYIGEPTMRLLPTSGGGTLFPPHSLHPEVFSDENIRQCCLLADDLWLKVMSVLQGTPIVLAKETRPLNFIEGTQEAALWHSNSHGKGNDKQLKAVLELYDGYHGEDDTVKRRIMENRMKFIKKSPNTHMGKAEKTPKISVILPVYNTEQYLRQCLDSILNQTISDIEIICVDDGSSDSSHDILIKYADIDSRIKVIKQDNRGAGTARNTGLAAAHGDYVHFFDSDDWMEANLYEVLYKNIREQEADVCLCFFETFDNITKNVEKQPNPLIKDRYLCTTSFAQNYRYFIYSRMGAVNKLYSRKLLIENDIWFQDISFAEDRSFYFHILLCAQKIAIVDEYLFYYRINNSNSLVGSASTSCKQECNFRSYEKIRELTKHAPLEVSRMIMDVSIRNFFRFYHNAEAGLEETMKIQLINYMLWMDLRLLGDMTKYPWYGNFCSLLNTASGLSYILETASGETLKSDTADVRPHTSETVAEETLKSDTAAGRPHTSETVAGASHILGIDRQTDLSSLKLSFWRYRILSKITFGKTRERYKRKKSAFRNHIRMFEASRKSTY